MTEEFRPFVGHLVKAVFRDGDRVIAKRGRLVSTSDNFLELRTLADVTLKASEVFKIQRGLGGESGEPP